MTMQAEQLIGARVIGGDGQVVGTVLQIFNDDRDGTPVWARIRAGNRDRFVPLAGSRATKDGLSVPYNAPQILNGPELGAGRHLSASQTDQLRRHFGLTVPAQARSPDVVIPPGDTQRRETQHGQTQHGEAQRGEAQRGETRGEEWLIRAEERVTIGTETLETGRARLHKYVDVEPVEQAVRVFREEYVIERIPITPEERIRGVITEAASEQEIILHEERAVFLKEAVPVERVRLVVRRVEEERTFRDEVRKERIEVETDGGGRLAGGEAQDAPEK